jgi:flagellar motor switch protein FliN/FliY
MEKHAANGPDAPDFDTGSRMQNVFGQTPTVQNLSLPSLEPVATQGGPAAPAAPAPQAAVAPDHRAAAPLLRSGHPLHDVKARVMVCVGGATITVGELLAARQDQVLRLDRAVDQPVDLLVEGQLIARGQLVAVDDYFGVRITELPLPLPAHGVAEAQ